MHDHVAESRRHSAEQKKPDIHMKSKYRQNLWHRNQEQWGDFN